MFKFYDDTLCNTGKAAQRVAMFAKRTHWAMSASAKVRATVLLATSVFLSAM